MEHTHRDTLMTFSYINMTEVQVHKFFTQIEQILEKGSEMYASTKVRSIPLRFLPASSVQS